LSAKSSDDLKDTNERIDTVIKLLAAMYARELKNNDAIVKLDNMNLSREQIAEAVGVTTHNVAQVLYSSKKGNGKKKEKGVEPSTPAGGEVPSELEAQQ
jgi:hypothetical protein